MNVCTSGKLEVCMHRMCMTRGAACSLGVCVCASIHPFLLCFDPMCVPFPVLHTHTHRHTGRSCFTHCILCLPSSSQTSVSLASVSGRVLLSQHTLSRTHITYTVSSYSLVWQEAAAHIASGASSPLTWLLNYISSRTQHTPTSISHGVETSRWTEWVFVFVSSG